MQIDLNVSGAFTKETLAQLVATGDDTQHSQYRVTKDGILFLSTTVGSSDTDGLLFRLETNSAGNSYAGPEAAADPMWIERLYNAINSNWPSPSSTYIDAF